MNDPVPGAVLRNGKIPDTPHHVRTTPCPLFLDFLNLSILKSTNPSSFESGDNTTQTRHTYRTPRFLGYLNSTQPRSPPPFFSLPFPPFTATKSHTTESQNERANNNSRPPLGSSSFLLVIHNLLFLPQIPPPPVLLRRRPPPLPRVPVLPPRPSPAATAQRRSRDQPDCR